jgi:hypothetical protein
MERFKWNYALEEEEDDNNDDKDKDNKDEDNEDVGDNSNVDDKHNTSSPTMSNKSANTMPSCHQVMAIWLSSVWQSHIHIYCKQLGEKMAALILQTPICSNVNASSTK